MLHLYIGAARGTQCDRDCPFCAGGFRAVVSQTAQSKPKPVDSKACERIETKPKSTWLLFAKVSSVGFVRRQESESISEDGSVISRRSIERKVVPIRRRICEGKKGNDRRFWVDCNARMTQNC